MKTTKNNYYCRYTATASIDNHNEEKSQFEQLESSFFRKIVFELLPNINDVVIVLDNDNQIIFMNRSAEALLQTSYKDTKGKKFDNFVRIYDAITEQDFLPQKLEQGFKDRQSRLIYHNMIMYNNNIGRKRISLSILPLEESNEQISGSILLINDNTLNHNLERELFKSHKFTNSRYFIGGIAHDFNNILSSIMGNITLAKHYLRDNPEDFEKMDKRLDIAEKACEKAHHLSSQLVNFSKNGSPNKEITTIEETIKETIRFICHGSQVEYDFCFSKNAYQVDIDVSQISQVINNIVINAIQSMPDGGKITIIGENHSLGNDEINGLPKGKYLKLSISDTGTGIPKDYADKIFEPFFTNKQGGTGLGLTSCKKIIMEHKGFITYESQEKQGTIFNIYLPAAKYKKKNNQNDILLPLPEKITSGSGKILVMEDDNEVKQVFGNILKLLGYEVNYSSNEQETYDMYRTALEKKDKYHAVIVDLIIPGHKGGKEAIKKLLSLDKDVKAILTTGRCEDGLLMSYKDLGFKALLTKPFSIQNLVQVLISIA